ncbi:CC0125/CC1285 family lipoprotein [Thalassotalea agarivorans]|uniref:Uncharacterized protein n=1 Tax=Thalassotalea agarivorans TaxID=349064 RepID=A0A1I0G959_THASX|nr:hypothetical protein [Thalassotalea agarivorans]SET66624.1 hypothetical protein SAMN05660429_02341 [Thalassotalea agarivorans]
MSIRRMPFVALVLLFLVSACTTQYHKRNFTGGYAEEKIDDNSYIVSFYGNGNTSSQQVWNMWIYRCAELTLANGYEFFELNSTTKYAYLENSEGLHPVTFDMLPQQQDYVAQLLKPATVIVTTTTTYSSTALVNMYSLPLPEEARIVLDAKTIIDALSVYVKKPTSDVEDRGDIYARAAVEAAIRANRIEAQDSEKLTNVLKKMI